MAQGSCLPDVPQALEVYARDRPGVPRIVQAAARSLEIPGDYGGSTCSVPVVLDNQRQDALLFHRVTYVNRSRSFG